MFDKRTEDDLCVCSGHAHVVNGYVSLFAVAGDDIFLLYESVIAFESVHSHVRSS